MNEYVRVYSVIPWRDNWKRDLHWQKVQVSPDCNLIETFHELV